MNKIIKNGMFLGLSTLISGYGTLLHAEASPTNLPVVSQKALTIIDGQTEWLNKVYKDIHEHPELGFMEKRTSAIVAKELKSLGFDVKTGIAKTGVVGILKMVKGQRLCTVPIWMPTLLKRQLVYHTRVKCA